MHLRPSLLLLLLVVLGGCAGAGLEGAWVLQSTDGRRLSSHGDRPVKILTPDHYAFGSQSPDGVFAGGGRWEKVGEEYVEIPDYHSIPQLVGRRLHFSQRIEGDLWYHEGVFEADGRTYRVQEVWKRLPESP